MQQSKGESLIRCDVLNPYAELDLDQMDKGVREREVRRGLDLNEGECYQRERSSSMQLPAHLLIKGKLYVI